MPENQIEFAMDIRSYIAKTGKSVANCKIADLEFKFDRYNEEKIIAKS